VNRFADLTNEEYRSQYLGYDGKDENEGNNTYLSNPWDIPSSLDWRLKNVLTAVKDSGECSSSWAFSAVSSVESQYALTTGHRISLSEQQVIDCSHDFGNEGCSGGGLTTSAFKYIKSAGGIDSTDSYQFIGEDSICKFTRQNVTAKVAGFVNVLKDDESVLKDAVANVGPISSAVDAGSVFFQFYSRGVLDVDDCQKEPNHAVTVVGYGVEWKDGDLSSNGTEYWILKNSWGMKWGENGYMKLARNQDNLCGVASQATYPLIQNF